MSEVYDLAGDKIVLMHEEGRDVLTFGDKGTGRVCGSCQLCCKLLPVPGPPLHKPGGVRCKHQRTGKGCTIYANRPFQCRIFACRWLADRETGNLPRPDRAHYVIDIKDDFVEMVHDDGTRQRMGVIQVWVDPAYRDAHRDPAFRAYMLMVAEKHRMATIVRFSSVEAITVFPPPLADDGQWHEKGGEIVTRDPTGAAVMADLERYKLGFTDE